jgi:hypothetical protein
VAALPRAQYDVDRTHCTGNPAPWFVERDTTVFLCIAAHREGGCDRYRATLGNAGWSVELERRNVGCTTPF